MGSLPNDFEELDDPDDLKNSKCTTIPVQPDKSNYWAVCSLCPRLRNPQRR